MLLINIAVASIVLFVIGYIVLNRLEKYTNHGYYITVPELRGLTPDEAKPFAKEKNLQILVIDSIYDNNAKPGTIVEEQPGHPTDHQRQCPGKNYFPEPSQRGLPSILATIEELGTQRWKNRIHSFQLQKPST